MAEKFLPLKYNFLIKDQTKIMTKLEFMQDLSQGLTQIRYRMPWTEFEKRQIDSGERSIKLSKGHLLFPYLSSDAVKSNASTTYADRMKHKSYTYPRKWKFFQMQLCLLVIINKNPYGNNLSDKDLLKGCVQFFIMNYVGNYDYLMDDFKVVSIELRKDLNLLKEYGYYSYIHRVRMAYPSCFVGKEAVFKCVEQIPEQNKTEKDQPDQNPTERKCDISRKARTRKRVEIIARSIFDIDTPTFDTYVTSQGYFTKQFMDDTNAKMVKYGFKPLKEAGFRALIEESLSVLGITREDLVFNECGFYTNKSSDPVMLFRLFPDNKCA